MTRTARNATAALAALALAACSGGGTQNVDPRLVPPLETQDFGPVPVFNVKRLDVPVENIGRAMLMVESVTLTQPEGGPFSIVAQPVEVETGESLPIGIEFVPPEEKDYSATLTLVTNDQDNKTVTIQLLGKGSTRAIMEIEPAAIDFGRVAEGTSAVKSIAIRSKGTADLVLNSIAFVDGSSTAFEFLGSVSTPATVPIKGTNGLPGQILVTVRYTVAPGTTADASAQIRITGTDPDQREVLVPVTGSVNRAPIAVIKPLGVGAPGLEVTLDGTDSSDPDGDLPLTYKWTLRSKPLGAKTAIVGSEQPVTHMTLDAELPGEYVVELNVTDAAGAKNLTAARASIVSAPAQKLLVEMFWNHSQPDIDLHMLRTAETVVGDIPDDCHYMNPAPDWGELGITEDDPELVRDALVGYGPEVLGYVNPPDGKYRIVSYYKSTHRTDGAPVPAEITVRIYLYGVVRFEQKKTLSQNDEIWGVADIDWPSGVITALEP